MEAAVTVEAGTEQWMPGKNGGRLRNGGTHGPTKAAFYARTEFVKALKKAGGWKFYYALATGSAEDKRCFANIGAKLFPVEVQGDLGEVLRVVINTYVMANGEPQIPTEGTCVIGEKLERASIAAPNDATSINVAEEIER